MTKADKEARMRPVLALADFIALASGIRGCRDRNFLLIPNAPGNEVDADIEVLLTGALPL